MDETKQMQDKIEQELGLDPVENDVVVLYNGEKDRVNLVFCISVKMSKKL